MLRMWNSRKGEQQQLLHPAAATAAGVRWDGSSQAGDMAKICGWNICQNYNEKKAKRMQKCRLCDKNDDEVAKMLTIWQNPDYVTKWRRSSKNADYIEKNPTMWQKRWLYCKNSVANMPTLWQKCRLCGKSCDCMAKIPTMWQKCRQCDKKFTIQYMSKRIGRTITMNKKLITRGIQEKSRKANILQIVLFSEDIFQIGTETCVVSLPNPSAKNCNCSSTKEPWKENEN